MSALSILDIQAVRAAPLSREPYPYTLGTNVLAPEAIDAIRADFPDIAKPGYLTVDEVALKGPVQGADRGVGERRRSRGSSARSSASTSCPARGSPRS